MSDHYRRDQIQDAATSHDDPDEPFLRLKIGTSKHLNITKVEAFAIAALLDRNDNPPAPVDELRTFLADLASGPGYLRKDGADSAKRLLDQLPDGPGVVTPLNGIRSGEHYRRCDEMAGWVRGMVGYDRRAAVDQTNIAAWFAYMAGSTSERPW